MSLTLDPSKVFEPKVRESDFDSEKEGLVPSSDIGESTSNLDMKKSAEDLSSSAPCCMIGSIGHDFLRFGAGAVGVLLYGISFVINGILTIAILVPALILGLPGAAIGAAIGRFIKGNAEVSGTYKGAFCGELVVGSPLFLAEAIAEIPKVAVCYILGYLGAGALAFAIKGTTNSKIGNEMWRKLEQVSYPVLEFISLSFKLK